MNFVIAQKTLIPYDQGSKVHFVIKNFGIKTGGDFSGLNGTIKFDQGNIAFWSFDVTVKATVSPTLILFLFVDKTIFETTCSSTSSSVLVQLNIVKSSDTTKIKFNFFSIAIFFKLIIFKAM